MNEGTFFGRPRWFLSLVLFTLFAMGLGLRLFDLTDPPIDFHPTRQLRSAVLARGLYYRMLPPSGDWQQQRAVEQIGSIGLIEPPIFEGLTAVAYRLIGSEQLWVARIFASLFWIVGGLALYFLARDLTNADGGVVAVAYYLFLPFGVYASRSFQPDPLMVMFILLSLWAAYRWQQRPSWKSAILAGTLAGAALLVKAVAVYPLVLGLGLMILVGKGLRKTLRDPQAWAIAGLAVLPVFAYTLYGVFVLGSLESQFEGRFFPEMWRDPAFYVRWMSTISDLVGYAPIVASLFSLLLFDSREKRALGIGLWLGYFLYGMSFPYHINTHSYYHLPLIPIIALSLAPLAALVFGALAKLQPIALIRVVIFAMLLFVILVKAWDVRVELVQKDYRGEPAYWQEISDQLGHSSSVVGLTHDYGLRLAYYGWITSRVWLPSGHLENYRQLRGGAPIEVQKWFADLAGNKDYFLVTMVGQLTKQPELNEILYENYPIYAEGDGYVIFDLKQPLK